MTDEPTGLMRKFPYAESLVPASSAFPEGRTVYRPRLPVTLMTLYDGWLSCYAIVDSGADYCSFPQSLMKPLGIEPREFENIDTANGLTPVYFHVQIDLGFVEPYYTYAGFHPGNFAMLGHKGFLDRFVVVFDTANRQFVITNQTPTP